MPAFRRDGGCNDARLINGVKHDLAKPGFTGTNSWCTDFPVAELVAVVIRRLKSAAERATGERLERVVLGHPVVFAGARDPESQAEGLARLRRAAELAGFREVGFLPEPQAALAAAPRRPSTSEAAPSMPPSCPAAGSPHCVGPLWAASASTR